MGEDSHKLWGGRRGLFVEKETGLDDLGNSWSTQIGKYAEIIRFTVRKIFSVEKTKEGCG